MANKMTQFLTKNGFTKTGSGWVTDLKNLVAANEYKLGGTRILVSARTGKWEHSEQERGVLSAIAWRTAGEGYGIESLRDNLFVFGLVGPWVEGGR